VIRLFHDNRESGHFGTLTTAELVSRELYWAMLDATIGNFIASGKICHRITALHLARHGVNLLLPPPPQLGQGITMDFVTDLPESTDLGFSIILVIVDPLTKMAIYLPCRTDINLPVLACLFFEQVIFKYGIADNIITDRGTQFISRFWACGCSHLSINYRPSTASHPQTDGQTESQNQTIE